MIFEFEKKILKWMHENVINIALVVAVLVSIALRISLKDFVTSDYESCWLPWYDNIKAGGGLRGLVPAQADCNYNLPFQTLMALMTYVNVNPLYLYKIIFGFFDYMVALGVAMLVYDVVSNNKREYAILSYIVVIISPLVFLNSVAWPQTDAMYTSFVVLALAYMFREKYELGFILYGVAFGFKFQAVFVLPFIVFLYFVKKKFSLLYFLIIPAVMLIMSLPAIVVGRHVSEIFSIYFANTDHFTKMTLHYPTFWQLLNEGQTVDSYESLKKAAILFTVVALGCFMCYWLVKKIELTTENMIYMAMILTYTIVLFLPAMHERYGYLYEILAITIVFFNKKTFPSMIGLICVSLQTYGNYLYDQYMNLTWVTVANIIVYVSYVVILNRTMVISQNE